MEKPDVDYIEGLSPAISIDQKSTSRNPRSTVGTVTEIYDYLRLLFARVGTPHCYNCGREISSQSSEQIVDSILDLPEGSRISVAGAADSRAQGRVREAVRGDRQGRLRPRSRGRRDARGSRRSRIDKKRKHTIEVVVDRLVLKHGVRKRLTDSIETTLKLSSGIVTVLLERSRENSPLARPSPASIAGSRSKNWRRDCSRSTRRTARVRRAAVWGEDRDRSVAGDPRPEQVHRGRRDRSVEQELGSGRFPSMNPYYMQQLESAAPLPRQVDDARREALR